MKKLFSTLALVALTTFGMQAQTKEGYIVYQSKMEGLPPEQSSMFESETKVYFKSGKSLIEVNSMMYSMQMLLNDEGTLMLMDQMGNKFAVKRSKADLEAEAAKNKTPDPKIEYTNETKTIAGYECKKAIVTTIVDKKEVKSEIWYTDKLEMEKPKSGDRMSGNIKGLKGVPFEYSMNIAGGKMTMTASEVSTDPVSDSKFTLSTEGYKMMTAEELKNMGRGN
jgi:hypothetical protein